MAKKDNNDPRIDRNENKHNLPPADYQEPKLPKHEIRQEDQRNPQDREKRKEEK